MNFDFPLLQEGKQRASRQEDHCANACVSQSVLDYRGHWCPFCMSYMRKLQQLSKSIKARSGAVVAVTAEPESELSKTQTSSGYDGQVIVDPKNSLATELGKRGLLNVAITQKNGYAYGMAQPAILVLKSTEDVMFKWAIVPSLVSPSLLPTL